MSPQKRCSPRKKATPQKRSSPLKKVQSPAVKANRQLTIKRKVRNPISRSLAFGASPSLNGPISTADIYTESMPAPAGSSSSNSALFPLEMYDEPAVSQSATITNPFKRGSPLKKRRKTQDSQVTAYGSQVAPDWDDETANDSFSSPSAVNVNRRKSIFTRTKSQMDTSAIMSDYALDFSSVLDVSVGSKNGSPVTVEEKHSSRLPLDNRLGTRLRITSSLPYPWMTDTTIGTYHVRITGQDQHAGTQLFVQSGLDEISKPCLSTSGASSPSAILTAASSYWQHPVLPWLPLFPRLSAQVKLIKDHCAPPLAPAMLKKINEYWSESLEALFLSWKKGDRHSFYVCCPNVTAHFTRIREERRLGAGDESMSCFATSEEGLKHVVFITPTTSGFRSYLREEGVLVDTLDERGKRKLSRTGSFRMGDGDESRCSMGGDSSRLSIGSLTEGNGLNQSGGGGCVSFQVGLDDEKENSKSGDASTSRFGADDSAKSPEKEPKEDESEESGDETSPTKMGDAHDWLKTIGVSPASTLRMRRHHTAIGRLTTGSNGSKGGGTPTSAATRLQREKSDGVCTVVVRDSSSVQAFYNLLLNSKSVRAIAGPHAALPPTLLAAQPFPRAQLQTLEKRSQILKRAGREVEHVLEIDGGPIMPHAAQLAFEFARAILAESNSSKSTVPNVTIGIRVNDRSACNGLNSLLDEETGGDWTEMSVTEDGECRWKADGSR